MSLFAGAGGRERSRRPDPAPWEQFCKDEARRAAHVFLEKVRRLQTADRETMEVPESVFASKFSAHFMDEVMDLTGSSVGNGALHASGEFGGRCGSASKKAGGGKSSWWNIFKRRQSREEKTAGALVGSSAANRNAGLSQQQRQLYESGGGGAAAVMEAQVKMLDMMSPGGQLKWQACRLVLASEQGNHQLEVYCPPKSNFPKMSLFCFLLKEVRSSTSLELPDSQSSFVVKSDNHVEYVFDAGSEQEKERWVTTIRSHSSRLCHQNPTANGHIASKTRSHSISGAEHSRLNKSHHAVVSFPVRPQSQDTGMCPADPQLADMAATRSTVKSFSASPSPCHSGAESLQRRETQTSCSSPAPERENTPTFFRCRPQRSSPGPRPRRTLSMYEHGSLVCPSHSHSQSNPHSHSQTPSSPSPPLPKRSQRSLSSLSELPTTPTARTFVAAGVHNGWPIGSNPAIVTSSSSPHAGSVPADNPFSSNLDNCSQNSSSSALHPVTLNATNVPQPQRSRNGRHSSVSSLNASPTSLPRQLSGPSVVGRSQLSPSSSRKVSSTASVSPSGSTNWTRDIEEEVQRAKQRFPSCEGLSDPVVAADVPSHTIFPALDCSSPGVVKRKHEGSPSPPLNPFPNLPSPSASPSVLRRFSPTLDSYREETTGPERERDSDVIEVFPSRDQVGVVSPVPPQQPSRPRKMRFFSDTHVDEITHEPHTLTTPSPSSGSSEASNTFESHPPQEHNGVFIELSGPERVVPGLPSSVTHPYASWAVTLQDAENLRQLVQFQWFHGMISRANATQLVLTDGESGSGRYLVRQSESREGEFVLTFNYKGRAKHLRIVLDSSGCSVQHLFFNTVSSMLEYFHSNTIPLETCWNEDDCRITDYIDRSASDSLRTITAIYSNDLLSSPRLPRRSHSLQMALTQAVMSTQQHRQNSLGGGNLPEGGPRGTRVRRGSSSLPHNTQHQTGVGAGSSGGGGWRNLFWPNRASTLQRRHSEMADMHHAIDNNYVFRY